MKSIARGFVMGLLTSDHFKVKAAKTVLIPKEFLNAIQMQSIPLGNKFSFSVQIIGNLSTDDVTTDGR